VKLRAAIVFLSLAAGLLFRSRYPQKAEPHK